MSELANFTNALLGSTNTATKVIGDYLTKQAQLSTDIKNSQLQTEINAELARIKQSTNFEDWNAQIADFFEKRKAAMSDKNSTYYCQNNLQAEMFTSILDKSIINVSAHVNNMVIDKQLEKNKIDVNKGIINYKNLGLSGQNLYDKCKELIDNAYAVGTYSQAEYEQLNDAIFYDSYSSMYINMFRESSEEAIKRGDSLDKIWDTMQTNAAAMMKVDSDQMPSGFDKEAYDKKIKSDLQREYNAKQQDIWDQTEMKFADYYDRMLDQRTAEGRNNVKSQARSYIDTIKNTGLASADQITKWTARFVLEDYLDPEGSTTASQASAALKKLTPEQKIEFYLNAAKRGDESELGGPATIYNARDLYQKDIWDEFKEATGNPDLLWSQVEEQCPTVMTFIDKAKEKFKNTPLEDVATYAQNLLEAVVNTKGDSDKYKEEINATMDVVWDMLFETNISDLDEKAIQSLKDRTARFINSKYGGVLEKSKAVNDETRKMLKKTTGLDTLRNYREGVFNNEKTMAKALQEREANPDLVYKDQYGNTKPTYKEDVEQGLTSLEAAEKKEIAAYIKQNTGFPVNEKDIKGDYEEDGAYDWKAGKIYTVVAKDQYGRSVDEYQYKLSSKDGEHITLQRKKKGSTQWEEVRTASQQQKYESVDAQAQRAVEQKDVSTIPEGGFTYTDEDGTIQKFTYTDPEGEEKEISSAYWKYLRPKAKQALIAEFIQKNPEAAQKWLNSLKNK